LEEVPRIEKIAGNLAAFFRYSARLEPLEVTLREEIDHLRKYLEIIDIRFKQNFQSQIYVNEKFMEVHMVKLSLQPIVENAVKYAVEPMNGNAAILINAYDEGDDLILEVADNGPGIPPDIVDEVLTKQSRGYGLRNVQERIRIQYGSPYGITIESEPGCWTRVFVTIPIVE